MDFVEPARAFTLELLGGRGHYERVVQAVMNARRSVWIATANLKELMVEDHRAAPGRRRTLRTAARNYRSILAVFDELAARGVELRILHAGVPSRAFRAALAKRPRLKRALAMRACPRVHFKTVIVDGGFIYVGSANWTGAGLGAKGIGRRNFELGFAGSDDGLLDRGQEMIDTIWRGVPCHTCKLRDMCPTNQAGTLGGFPGPPATTPLGKAQLRPRDKKTPV